MEEVVSKSSSEFNYETTKPYKKIGYYRKVKKGLCEKIKNLM